MDDWDSAWGDKQAAIGDWHQAPWESPSLDWARAWERQAQIQLAEREAKEKETAKEDQAHRDAVVEKWFRERKRATDHGETPETVMKKYNLTQEQWNALPDAPVGHWDKLMASHKK